MASVVGKNTRPEIIVRSLLHRLGLRFRIHGRLPGTPDIVLRKHMTAIEVRGCFWHRHPGCKTVTMPSSNCEYWEAKFRRNLKRDRANRIALRKLGWRLIVTWECELKKPLLLERKLRKAFGIENR